MNQPGGSQVGPSSIVTAAGLALIAAAAAIVTIVVRNGNDSATAKPPTTVAVVPDSAGRTSVATSSPVPLDPEAQAQSNLARDLFLDRSKVDALVGKWVAQLSAKRLGTEDDGIVYKFSDIYALHERLRSKFNALLLDSAAFAFDSNDLYVNIAPHGFDNPDDALAFCRFNKLTNNYCFARLITHDPTVKPRTKMQP